LNRLVVHSSTTLLVHILFQIARETGHNFDPHASQELSQIFLSWLEEDCEVAPVDDVAPITPCLLHQKAKGRIKFWRTTSDVYCLCSSDSDQLERQFSCPPIHDLGPPGAGIDMAVDTRLVTEFADVDLDSVDACSREANTHLAYPLRKR
jgi:hypothetical protein